VPRVVVCGTISGTTEERARKYWLALLAVLAYLDQHVTDADASLADRADADDHPAVRDIRAMLTDMRTILGGSY
jgi:hypothetical protein